MAKTLLGVKEDGLYVRAVRPDTSAQAARITPGDQILAVNENKISEGKRAACADVSGRTART